MMNRKIKFRFWHLGEKKMASWEEIGCELTSTPMCTTHGTKDMHFHLDQIWQKISVESVAMQYIGQNDRNGKEIYEGDICRQMVGGTEIIGTMTWSPERTAYGLAADVPPEVIAKLPKNMRLYTSEDGRPEVIGNIFENPELLKMP